LLPNQFFADCIDFIVMPNLFHSLFIPIAPAFNKSDAINAVQPV